MQIDLPERHTICCAIGSGRDYVVPDLIKGIAKHLNRAAKVPHERERAMIKVAGIIRYISEIDDQVSSESICAWLDYRKTGDHAAFDANGARVRGVQIPTFAGGYPVNDLAKMMWPFALEQFEAMQRAEKEGGPVPEIDRRRIEEALAQIDTTPNRKFLK